MISRLRTDLWLIPQLALVGLLVGLACWPLNLVDHWQDQLLQTLPGFTQGSWTWSGVLMACSPIVVMPSLLALLATRWRSGAGSGIPQTMVSLEQPDRAAALMGTRPVLQRMVSWSIASLSLFPMGREGPLVQVGAAVAQHVRQRWPGLASSLGKADLMAVAAGAGLAGGFNSPFMGIVFVAEELTHSFAARFIWPGLVICAIAAEVSNLGGEPLFVLGIVRVDAIESSQLIWGAVLGGVCGLAGGLFARLLFETTRWLTPRVRRAPWRSGVILGSLLSVLMLLTGGLSGGDGEAVIAWLIDHPNQHHVSLLVLVSRILGPCLALGGAIPGGLIDPAFAIGAVVGDFVGHSGGAGVLGVALGMAGALAGATHLPALSLVFAMHMAGDQQLLPGVLLSAVIGAYVGRVWMHKPVYHALTELMQKET